MPYLIEDGEGKIHANDWAKGFLAATHLRFDVWAEIVNDEERSGPFVPMWALAYENSEEPITVKIVTPVGGQKRQEKPVIGCFLACSICFADRSLIGASKSSILKTDALAGVTVLYGVGLGRPIMGVRGEALQRVKRPFHRQQPARSRFNPPSRPGQRLRECGAGTMN
jgi:hypothetical protein